MVAIVRMKHIQFSALALLAALLAGCGPGASSSHSPVLSSNQTNAMAALKVSADPMALVLAPHSGDSRTDKQIIQLQQKLPSARQPVPMLEQLGWLFVSKARESFDPGFYTLAEACAACIEGRQPDANEALLLRGHVLQNLHRFKEAEPLARKLVARRGAPFDFGLLGDVLMEQGRLAEAVDAYQMMVDLKPGPQAYARIAHLRWLKGDLDGAVELMREAAGSVSGVDAEVSAWMLTKLAAYQWQQGDTNAARQSAAKALVLQKTFPPTLLLLGKMDLAQGRTREAAERLQLATRANPLPEYQWALWEALRASGQAEAAEVVERNLMKHGAAEDPRTFSLYLATRRIEASRAVELAEQELLTRADVHTHDARAWALAAAGRWEEARRASLSALAEDTADPRLLLHAGCIAEHLGLAAEARLQLEKVVAAQQVLLPSERDLLKRSLEKLMSATNSAGIRASIR
jgi:tetratricopeptide (TPR) repeat protein